MLLIIALAVVAGYGFASLLLPDCDNEVFLVVPSPDGSLTASVFSRTCGVTTDFNTQISIYESAAGPDNDPGNILIMDDAPSVNRLDLRWQDNSQLFICAGGNGPIFRQATDWRQQVAITYRISRPSAPSSQPR